MITNKIILGIIGILSIIVIPIQIISTFVLGLLVSLTFGLLLVPISFIWIVLFLGPLLGLSYVYERVSILRFVTSIIGIPIALIGDVYVSLMPSMGEWDSRFQKLIMCETFPYTWKFIQYQKGKINITKEDALTKILKEVSKDSVLDKYLDEMRVNVFARKENIDGKYDPHW